MMNLDGGLDRCKQVEITSFPVAQDFFLIRCSYESAGISLSLDGDFSTIEYFVNTIGETRSTRNHNEALSFLSAFKFLRPVA
jgi:hypothetical protein